MAYPLFKGCTRPSMIMGIPTEAAFAAFVGVAIIAIAFGNMLLWILLLPIGIVFRMIAKKDDRAFRIIGIWIDTKIRYPKTLRKKWGACSYSLTEKRKLK